MLRSKTQVRTIVFWSLVVGLHLLYFGYQLTHGRLYLSDSYEYASVARSIVTDRTTAAGSLSAAHDNPGIYTKRPPLYPLLLALTGTVWGVEWLTLIVQNLLSLFNIWLVVRLLDALGFSRNFRFGTVGILLAAYPAQFIYANMIMSEILLQAILISALYSVVHFVRKGSIYSLIAYNVLLFLAALTKPVMYLFVVPNLLLTCFFGVRMRRAIIALTGFIPILLVAGYCMWNFDRTGYFHFSSIQNDALLHYNAYHTLLDAEGEHVADSVIDGVARKAEHAASFGSEQRIMREGALAVIEDHWLRYAIFHARGMLHFLVDPGRFDLYQFFGLESGSSRGLLFYFGRDGYAGIWSYLRHENPTVVIILLVIGLMNLIKALSIPLFAIDRNVRIEIKLALLLLVGYLVAVTGPLGASRFAMPVFPLLVITTAFAARQVLHFHARIRSGHVWKRHLNQPLG